jgi:hypothetical protein
MYMVILEHEEEEEVSEEGIPPSSDPQTGNCFYFDICGTEEDSPDNKGKPRCICHPPCCFKNLFHLLDALGDRG